MSLVLHVHSPGITIKVPDVKRVAFLFGFFFSIVLRVVEIIEIASHIFFTTLPPAQLCSTFGAICQYLDLLNKKALA